MQETFYDKSTGLGFIEFRLKTVRKSLNPSEKRRKPPKQRNKLQQRLSHQKCPVFSDDELLNSETLEKQVFVLFQLYEKRALEFKKKKNKT